MDRLSQGQMIAAGSAVVLVLSLFLKWLGVDVPAGTPEELVGDASRNGWETQSSLDVYFLIVAAFALIPALVGMTGGSDEIPFVDSAATFLLGAIGTILTLAVLLDPGAGLERKFGLFLATIAIIGVTIGSYMAMQDEVGRDY